MKVAFDLDGTLDRATLRDLCLHLLRTGVEVSIITGVFPEAAGWQDAQAKRAKLNRLGIPFDERHELDDIEPVAEGIARLYVLNAVPQTFDRPYRLVDLGLRKGALCERLGAQMIFDDSSTYVEMVPKMSGDTLVLKVGEGK